MSEGSGTGTPVSVPVGGCTLANIMQAVRDQYTIETISNAVLGRRIAAAVRFYSRYNPYRKTWTLSTEGDKQEYALPADCIVVLDCQYWPSGGLGRELVAGAEWVTLEGRPASYDLISERVIDEINRSEHIRRVQGRWEVKGSNVVLWPVPSQDGLEAVVLYGAVHALTGDEYPTVPAEDLEIVRDLVLAEIVEGKRVEFAVEDDYAEGQQRSTKHFIPASAAEAARVLRARCIDKYSGSAAGVS